MSAQLRIKVECRLNALKSRIGGHLESKFPSGKRRKKAMRQTLLVAAQTMADEAHWLNCLLVNDLEGVWVDMPFVPESLEALLKQHP